MVQGPVAVVPPGTNRFGGATDGPGLSNARGNQVSVPKKKKRKGELAKKGEHSALRGKTVKKGKDVDGSFFGSVGGQVWAFNATMGLSNKGRKRGKSRADNGYQRGSDQSRGGAACGGWISGGYHVKRLS